MHVRTAFSLVWVSLALGGCFIAKHKHLAEVPASPQTVESALRVFMADGSVLVFRDGALIDAAYVTGRSPGRWYDITRTQSIPRSQAPLDSVIGLESFSETTDGGLTILASVGIPVLAVAGVVGIACAADPKCFGSCPTVYSYDDQGERLEAEAFSYSISPLLEGRDVDRLAVRADADGRVDLEIRNEALETHFINHMELLEVQHQRHERVVPDVANQLLVVGSLEPVGRVVDRDERDVTEAIAARDGEAFATSESRLAEVDADGLRDWLAFELPPVETDSVALVLRLRNSLLTTVLFYDLMLARQGARALDWMARDAQQLGPALQLGAWYQKTMGLRLLVESDEGFREVARMGDAGPIAWKEVAFMVPARADGPTRVRLSFLADQWRIDHLAWSASATRPEAIIHRAAALTPLNGESTGDGRSLLAEPDEDYLVTTAGTGFRLRFDTSPDPDPEARTFFLGSQGYYSEWVRPDWIRSTAEAVPFEANDALLPDLMARWLERKGPMEAAFHTTKIPVR
jgi:hypothetical protein